MKFTAIIFYKILKIRKCDSAWIFPLFLRALLNCFKFYRTYKFRCRRKIRKYLNFGRDFKKSFFLSVSFVSFFFFSYVLSVINFQRYCICYSPSSLYSSVNDWKCCHLHFYSCFLLTPQMCLSSPCCYYRRLGMKEYKNWVISNYTIFIPNFRTHSSTTQTLYTDTSRNIHTRISYN